MRWLAKSADRVVAAALVDSASTRHLAHAITKQAGESEALRPDNEQRRKVGTRWWRRSRGGEAGDGVAAEMQMQRR